VRAGRIIGGGIAGVLERKPRDTTAMTPLTSIESRLASQGLIRKAG
jgi:hypothetical protein